MKPGGRKPVWNRKTQTGQWSDSREAAEDLGLLSVWHPSPSGGAAYAAHYTQSNQNFAQTQKCLWFPARRAASLAAAGAGQHRSSMPGLPGHTGTVKSSPACEPAQQTGLQGGGAGCRQGSRALQPAPRCPRSPAWQGLAAPQRSAPSNSSRSQPPFCPGVICLSHPCRIPRVMGEQPSSHQQRLWLLPEQFFWHTARSLHAPELSPGKKAVGTGCGPDKLSHLPQKLTLHRMKTWFLQCMVIIFQTCCDSAIIGLLFVHFSCVYIWSAKEGPGLIASVGSSGNRDNSCSFLPDLGQTTYTQQLGSVWIPTSHLAEQEWKAVPYQENTDVNVPYLPGPLWRWRHFWSTETRVMAVIQKSYIWERVVQTQRKSCMVT